jgi:Domain of unknown function (DUF1906)
VRSPFHLFVLAGLLAVAGALPFISAQQQIIPPSASKAFLGFDRNDYPGDDALPILRKSYSFTSYWLSSPPGETQSTWLGKRSLLQSQGFGFMLLFNAKESRDLEFAQDAVRFGTSQANSAAKIAKQEGFPEGTVIFLDVEEGGRLPDLYHAYLQSWYDTLVKSGFHAGVYCSGIPVNEGAGTTIVTADDIRTHMGTRDLLYWVYNDACPPSPGCASLTNPPAPSKSGTPYATIWQFVRSPREKQFARHCSGYAPDGNCYAPADSSHRWFLDVNVASSSDPSAPKK